MKRGSPWALGWCRARSPGGWICKRPYKPTAEAKAPRRARELSHPGRNRFSFNYMFHVHVPVLHARRLLSRPNISHAYPHLNTPVVAYLNTSAHGLQRTCAAARCLRPRALNIHTRWWGTSGPGVSWSFHEKHIATCTQ